MWARSLQYLRYPSAVRIAKVDLVANCKEDAKLALEKMYTFQSSIKYL